MFTRVIVNRYLVIIGRVRQSYLKVVLNHNLTTIKVIKIKVRDLEMLMGLRFLTAT
jgi:hypothetical protein